ncbi:MAG: NAD(P)/FAD-dependent oxidoreductase [Hadesarchaea archaeon]|nr:NAD(P)/FAD-dependent oxidoreductase [Hadesarchaea archaeon]
MKESYDVVVVGAGPAGSVAAYSAAKGGANVLMLERRREIGVPVQCGEALSEDVLKEMKIKPDPSWAVNPTSSVKIVSPSGIAVRISERRVTGKVGYILNRKVFDKYLAVRAAEAGADIRVGTYVYGLVMRDGRICGVRARGVGEDFEVGAKVVIAADGVGSRVARWAGMNTAVKLDDFESGIQFQMVGVDFESPTMLEFYLSSRIAPGGYAWVFPKGEHMANVGLGVLGSRAERRAIDYLRDFVANTPALAKGKVVEINAGGIPVGGPLKQTVKGNVVLVGDAARQVNALTGGGIDSAMRAGQIAGEVVAEAVKEGDVSERKLKEYERRWREKMGKSHERYLKAKNVLLSLSDRELDQLAETLAKVDFERISLTDMLKVLVRSHPKLLWKLKGLV